MSRSDAFALLWDAHHTYRRRTTKQPAETYAALGRWVRHTHLKDSMPAGADAEYVLTGNGDVPVKAQVKPRGPATRATTASSGRRSGTRKSRSRRLRSRTTRRR